MLWQTVSSLIKMAFRKWRECWGVFKLVFVRVREPFVCGLSSKLSPEVTKGGESCSVFVIGKRKEGRPHLADTGCFQDRKLN